MEKKHEDMRTKFTQRNNALVKVHEQLKAEKKAAVNMTNAAVNELKRLRLLVKLSLDKKTQDDVVDMQVDAPAAHTSPAKATQQLNAEKFQVLDENEGSLCAASEGGERASPTRAEIIEDDKENLANHHLLREALKSPGKKTTKPRRILAARALLASSSLDETPLKDTHPIHPIPEEASCDFKFCGALDDMEVDSSADLDDLDDLTVENLATSQSSPTKTKRAKGVIDFNAKESGEVFVQQHGKLSFE